MEFQTWFNNGWGLVLVIVTIIALIWGVGWLAAREEVRKNEREILPKYSNRSRH
jgi:hypothetical protein